MSAFVCPYCGGQVQAVQSPEDQVIACPHCAQQMTIPRAEAAPPTAAVPPASTPPVPSVSNGLATASLVLGVLSFLCFGPFCSIPAIITGHMGLSRSRRLPEAAGKGMAIAGLVVGYVSLTAFLVLAVILSACRLVASREAARHESRAAMKADAFQRAAIDSSRKSMETDVAQRAACQNNLKEIGLVFKIYANDDPGSFYPELSPEAGRLMFASEDAVGQACVYPKYLNNLSVLVCLNDTSALAANSVSEPGAIIDDHSYWYLGYRVTSDEEMEAFAEAYREHIAAGGRFSEDLDVPPGRGNDGGDKLLRLREKVGRFLITDINDIAAAQRFESMPSTIPTLIERPENHLPAGGNVLYLDGHVEFVRYPGKWPMTEKTIGLLRALGGP